MTPPTRRKLLLAALCVLAVVVARALLSLAMIHDGFRALSDDDYSRVVIAQQFVARPSVDPSRTSWLPFPFWLYGTLMAGLGGSLAVARGLGFAFGLASSVLVWVAGRWLGLSRSSSLAGTLIGMSIPYSAWLGLATTPDFYTAALIIVACASLTRRDRGLRTLGAVALMAASLSRYEAWPVVLAWSLFTGRDAVRLRNLGFAWLSAAVLAAPLLWMLHGLQLHHDALFFIDRVTSYQQALGPLDGNGFARVMKTPSRLLGDAPELWALVIIVAALSQRRGIPLRCRHWARPLWCLLALVAFLCVGDWNGSTATHHAGRTLLAVWQMVALMCGAGLVAQANTATAPVRARILTGALIAIFVAALGFRALPSRSALQDREEEVALGLLAAAQVPKGESLAIDTPDYGYFAVQAAFARPLDTRVLDTRDPRRRADSLDSSQDASRLAFDRVAARWVVVSREHEHYLARIANIRHRGPTLVFAQLR